MLTISVYVVVQAIRGLLDRSQPDAAVASLTLAAVSLVVLPYLGLLKLRVASRLRSPALRGDGTLTIASAALAATTLAALIVNSAFAWWWGDAVAALLIAAALAVEAIRVLVRHRFG